MSLVYNLIPEDLKKSFSLYGPSVSIRVEIAFTRFVVGEKGKPAVSGLFFDLLEVIRRSNVHKDFLLSQIIDGVEDGKAFISRQITLDDLSPFRDSSCSLEEQHNFLEQILNLLAKNKDLPPLDWQMASKMKSLVTNIPKNASLTSGKIEVPVQYKLSRTERTALIALNIAGACTVLIAAPYVASYLTQYLAANIIAQNFLMAMAGTGFTLAMFKGKAIGHASKSIRFIRTLRRALSGYSFSLNGRELAIKLPFIEQSRIMAKHIIIASFLAMTVHRDIFSNLVFKTLYNLCKMPAGWLMTLVGTISAIHTIPGVVKVLPGYEFTSLSVKSELRKYFPRLEPHPNTNDPEETSSSVYSTAAYVLAATRKATSYYDSFAKSTWRTSITSRASVSRACSNVSVSDSAKRRAG